MTNFREDERVRGEEAQVYLADYSVISTGTVAVGRRRVENTGIITISIGKTALSHYLFLVDDAAGDNGFFPTGTVFNGPAHANSDWGFWGSPQFLSMVSTACDGAWYWDKKYKKTFIKGDSLPPDTVPYFAQGFKRNHPKVDLPTTVLSQERAALGLAPANLSQISDTERATAVGLTKG